MAETEYSIQVEHVEKSFRVFLDKGQSFKERLLFRKRNRYESRTQRLWQKYYAETADKNSLSR